MNLHGYCGCLNFEISAGDCKQNSCNIFILDLVQDDEIIGKLSRDF